MDRGRARLLAIGGLAAMVGVAIGVASSREPSLGAHRAPLEIGELEPATARPAPLEPHPRAPSRAASRGGEATPAPPRLEVAAGAGGAAPDSVVRLRADEPLASVNGVPITLAHLMPVGPGAAGAEHALPRERYAFLLERAIERELTFQEAGAQGVGLGAAQQRNLERLRARAEAGEPGAFDALGRTAENARFEQRELAALVLQSELAIRAGSPGPHVTSDMVERHYREHRGDYGALPEDPAARDAAWRRLDAAIRERLAPEVEAEHARRVRETLDELRARADIRISRPPA